MPLKNISREDVYTTMQGLHERGVPEDRLEEATGEVLKEIDYQRSKDQGPSLFLKSALAATPRHISDKLYGIPAFTPGDGKFDETMRNWSTAIQDKFINPNWERQMAEASSGTLNPLKEGGLDTWAAIMGGQTPVMADMAISKSIGKLLGGAAGAGIAAIAGQAGPQVTTGEEVATVPLGAKIGGIAGEYIFPLASLSLNEAGSFLRESEMSGVDEDIAKKYAPAVGVINGAIEEVQQIGLVYPYFKNKASGKAFAKLMKTETPKKIAKMMAEAVEKSRPGLLKRAFSELGVNLGEGLEEMAQTGTSTWALKKAYAEMRERHGDDWAPAFEADADLLRSGLVGFGVSAITRTGARTAALPYAVKQSVQERITSEKVAEEQAFESLEEGKKPDIRTKAPDQAPLGERQLQEEVKERGTKRSLDPKDAAKTAEVVDSLTFTGLVSLLSRAKLKAPNGKQLTLQSPETLKQMARSNFDLLTEGYQVKVNKKTGEQEIVFNPIVVDSVPEGERIHGKRIHDALRETIKSIYEGSSKEAEKRTVVKALKDSVLQAQTEHMRLSQRVMARVNETTEIIKVIKQQLKRKDLPIEQRRMLSDTKRERTNELKVLNKELKQSRENVSNISKQALKQVKELKLTLPSEDLATSFYIIRNEALREAGIGEELLPKLNPIDRSENMTYNAELDTKLTNTQHIRYNLALQGKLYRLASENFSKDTIANLDKGIYQLRPPTVKDHTGKLIDIRTEAGEAKQAERASLLTRITNRLQPFLGLMQTLQNKTGMDYLGNYLAVNERLKEMNETMEDIQHAINHIYRQIPSKWIRGKGRRLYDHGMLYLMMNNKERKLMSKELDFEHIHVGRNLDGNIRALAERLKTEMKLDASVDEIVKSMKESAERAKIVFEYPMKSGMMSFKLYREHYVPMMRDWANKRESNISFEEFVRNEYNTKDKMAELSDNPKLAEKYLTDIVHLGDSIKAAVDRGLTVPGAATPSAQRMRLADEAWGLKFGLHRIYDFEMLTDSYFRQLLRKVYFGDLAPTLMAFVEKIDQAASEDPGRDDYKLIMGNFMDSVLGVPDTQSKRMQSVNLRSDATFMGKMINGFADKIWNKIGLDRWADIPEKITPLDILRGMTGGYYAYLLGVTPMNFNLTSPLKNIATQNVMSASLGLRNYREALFLVGDTGPKGRAIREEIRKIDPRPEFPLPLAEDFMGKGLFRQFQEGAMALFRLSDQVNVYTAATTALVGWRRLEQIMDKVDVKNLKRADMDDVLFSDKRPNINDEAVYNTNPVPVSDQFKSTAPRGFKSISEEVFKRIKNGDVEEAKRMYVQYAVNLSQWHYGAGGSPVFLRNPLIKAMFMFTTWPLNYMQWTGFMANPKNQLLRRYMGIQFSQFAIVAALSALGYDAYKWIAMGALPEDLTFMGPIAELVQGLYGMVRKGGEAIQTEIAPTSAENKERAWNAARQRFEAFKR